MKRALKWTGVSLLALMFSPAILRAGLESATFVGDLVSSNPTNTDLVSAGDDHIRLIKAALIATFPNATKAFYFPGASAKTTAYNVAASDMNDLITTDSTSGAFNVTLPTLGASNDGWQVTIQKIDTSNNAVTVVGTIEGLSNYSLSAQWDGATFVWTGTAWNVTGIRGLGRLVTKTASATLATSELETTIYVTPASNTTLALPAAAGRKGRWYNIKRAAGTAFTVTIDANASETIDGDLTVPVWAGQTVRVMGDGTNWFIAESGGRLGRPAPGTITDYGGGTLPTGALLAFGQAVSRTTYADLFAQISTTYGVGDGTTTFNLPDLRGRVTAGEDDMGGVSADRLTTPLNGDTLAASGGAQSVTLTEANLPVVAAHRHFIAANRTETVNTPVSASDVAAHTGSFGSQSNYILSGAVTGTADATVGLTSNTGGFGSGTAHAVLQPTLVVQKVIWY